MQSTENVSVIEGNILTATEQYIAQQCNCVSVKTHGLSREIARKFPYADLYARRKGGKNIDKPGTITVCGDESKNERYVICMFSQYGISKPGSYGQKDVCDSFQQRLKWFKKCLELISELRPQSIAFPYKIGCGLAGGSWTQYKKCIDDFAQLNPHTKVVVYKLAEN
jgi:O-acetyl-ADP-ribose deacetylase (regulator of RNase III)